jgi:hypothetical protein
MDSQDLIKISHKAKSETEAFINRHLNDRAKGWPKNYLYGTADTQYPQDKQTAEGSNVRISMSQ